MLVVSFFMDTVLGASQFGSLLVALFLVTASLFTYEVLRREAILETGKWEATKVIPSSFYNIYCRFCLFNSSSSLSLWCMYCMYCMYGGSAVWLRS